MPTSSYKAISDKLDQNFAGTKDAVIRMLSGENVSVDAYAYLNTMTDFLNRDDVFGYLMHLEYLAHCRGDLLFAGNSYDEQENTHTCRIRSFVIRQISKRDSVPFGNLRFFGFLPV